MKMMAPDRRRHELVGMAWPDRLPVAWRDRRQGGPTGRGVGTNVAWGVGLGPGVGV